MRGGADGYHGLPDAAWLPRGLRVGGLDRLERLLSELRHRSHHKASDIEVDLGIVEKLYDFSIEILLSAAF